MADLEIKLDESKFRDLMQSLELLPEYIRKGTRSLWHKNFKQFLQLATLFHFAGGSVTGGTVGRVGMSNMPSRYGHLAESFKITIKQSSNTDRFGLYGKVKTGKSGGNDHGFILPMHEYGTAERFRTRRGIGGKFAMYNKKDRSNISTGSLPARHPFSSAVKSFEGYVNFESDVDKVIDRAIKRAMKKGGR